MQRPARRLAQIVVGMARQLGRKLDSRRWTLEMFFPEPKSMGRGADSAAMLHQSSARSPRPLRPLVGKQVGREGSHGETSVWSLGQAPRSAKTFVGEQRHQRGGEVNLRRI